MCISLLVASTLATVGGTAYSIDRQREAEKDQKRAARIEKRKAAIQNARERRRAAAEAQVARSRIQAQEAKGTFTSSGQTQSVGAINSQLAGNLSFSRQTEVLNNRILSAQNSAASAMTQAAYGQAAAALPGALGFGLGDQIKGNLSAGKTWWGGTPKVPSGSATFSRGVGSSNMGSVPFTA